MPALLNTPQNDDAARPSRPADISIRPATPEDADDLARLINYAGEGMPLHFWRSMAAPGEDAWAVGRARALRDKGAFSWRNAWIYELGGIVASTLVTYRIGEHPEPIDPATVPAPFVPLLELENLALGTQYVNVLATYPAFRGNGLGSTLLDTAAGIAGDTPLSIIVSDGNTGARRLYERHGFRTAAERPIAGMPGWSCDGANWVLMFRPGR